MAQGDLSYLPDTLTMAEVEHRVPLTEQEIEILRDLLAALGIDDEPAAVGQVVIADTASVLVHAFPQRGRFRTRGRRPRPERRRSRRVRRPGGRVV
ncbi:hypothetical protein [Nonomuraea sp. KM90]|uniref:hypothetical protein n=1 Tax=Nonomuraea sp. KM90 TaxID=3457428 RepID=UPI003FCDB128